MYSFGISLLVLAVICFIAGFFARVFFFLAIAAFVLAWLIGLVG